MKCVKFASPGEPDSVLQYADVHRPTPAHGEVLVRMLASPINPSDLMFIRGTYGVEPECPQIPGFEGVGVVEESGGGLKGRLFTGKRVVVMNRGGGNWTNYSVVPASQVIPLSSRLSVDQAATFFVNPATAWIMTQEVLKVRRGEWLLQTAANSSLGRMVIRLGQKLGFRTLSVVRSHTAAQELKAAGATDVVVFNPTSDSLQAFRDAVAATTNNQLRYAIDPVGGSTAKAALQSLTTGGRLVVYGTLSEQPLEFSPRLLMKNNISVEGFWLGHFMQRQNLVFKLRLVRRITKLILDGTLESAIRQSFGLDQIANAVQAAEQSGQAGKVLLMMGDEE